MATLTIGTNFVAGTKAKSSEVNGNFSNIVSWSTTLDVDNFATLTGELDFLVGTTKAVKIVNNGTAHSIDVLSNGSSTALAIANSVQLTGSKATILITDSVAQVTAGSAELKMALSASATIPAIEILHGSDVTFNLTKTKASLVTGTSALDGLVVNPTHLTIPSRTTAQKDALVAPLEGSVIYDRTAKQLQVRTDTQWLSAGLNSISTAHLQDNSVTLAKMADNSVSTAEIVNGSVTAAKLAAGVGVSSFVSYVVPDFSFTFTGAFTNYRINLGTTTFVTSKPNSIISVNLTSDLGQNSDLGNTRLTCGAGASCGIVILVTIAGIQAVYSYGLVATTNITKYMDTRRVGHIIMANAGSYSVLVDIIYNSPVSTNTIATYGLKLEMVELA